MKKFSLTRNRRALACILLTFAATPMAFAHATLVRSTPADRSVVHSSSVTLTLDFNSRIDAARSSLTLTGPAGENVLLQIQRSSRPSQLEGKAGHLARGLYRIHWQVLASDGHITRGDVTFTVAKN